MLIVAGILAGVTWRHDVGLVLVILGVVLVVLDLFDVTSEAATAVVMMPPALRPDGALRWLAPRSGKAG